MTASSALALGQRSNPEMGEVKEERFARVHWAWWGPQEDCICWILVKPATVTGGSLDTFGHSKVFELILVDGRSGKTIWAGGEMGGGGGHPGASAQPGAWDPSVCDTYTCDGPGAKVGVAYAYRLGSFCGAPSTHFDGRQFYVEAIDPTNAGNALSNANELGTMTLLSSHVAVFRSSAGNLTRFADAMPGVLGRAYPFRAWVISGGSQLADKWFAGRAWHAQGALPGFAGPPDGYGQGHITEVAGTFTLTGPHEAVFRSGSGVQVPFVDLGLTTCD